MRPVPRRCSRRPWPSIAPAGGSGAAGGAYDRPAAHAPPPGWTIVGVCADEDLLDDLPEEPHDQRVDAILGDGGFFVVGGADDPRRRS
jgi:hypothetical protein